MFTITGKTYEHREVIKSFGGKWDGTRKIWTLADTTPDYIIDEIRALPGVIVSSATGNPPTFEPAPRKVRPATQHENETAVYGDDRTYFNAFARKNPLMFAGFSSMDALVSFIDAIPNSVRRDNTDNRNAAWTLDNGTRGGAGTDTMAEAISVYRDGWITGIERAREAMEIIEGEHVMRRQHKLSVAGGRANVGRMLSGNPVHMVNRPRQHAKKVITLFVNLVMSWRVTIETAIIRAATVAALADILETNGYSCEIIGIGYTVSSADGSPVSQVAVRIKSAGETLNLNNTIFALGHPSMARRFLFALYGNSVEMRKHWSGFGKPEAAFNEDHPTEVGSLYTGHLNKEIQAKIEGKTFTERVRSLFPLIVPDDFPVRLTE